jgi:hypothetical protein
VVWVFLSTEPARRSHVSRSGHQVSQSAQVVGGPGEGKQPSHLVDPSQLHSLEHPHHLHPPERLLHSLSLPLIHRMLKPQYDVLDLVTDGRSFLEAAET